MPSPKSDTNAHENLHPAQDDQTAPVELLRALEAAHSHLSAWQVEMAARHAQLNAEAAHARAQQQSAQNALESLQAEILQLRGENARLENEYQTQCGGLQDKLEQRNAELEKHREAIEKHRDALNEHKTQLTVLADQLQQSDATIQEREVEIEQRTIELKQRDEEIKQRDAEIQKRDHELQQRNEELRDRNDKLRYQIERNHELHDQLLKLYEDMTAADLPTLILRVCVNLTHSEHGLFVEADGDGKLSEIGLKDMPEAIANSLYDFHAPRRQKQRTFNRKQQQQTSRWLEFGQLGRDAGNVALDAQRCDSGRQQARSQLHR